MKTILNLLGSLTAATINGKLFWEQRGDETTGLLVGQKSRSPEFMTTLPDGHKIIVAQAADPRLGTSDVSIKLQDAAGKIIDQDTVDQFGPEYADLQQFFDTARRSANNVSSVIENVEQILLKLD